MPRAMQTFDSLMKKVAVCQHGLGCNNCCWQWLGCLDTKGYPSVGYHNKVYIAHKLIFSLKNNIDLSEKYFACHNCDNSCCCNWNHIYKGDHLSNMLDRSTRGRNGSCKGEKHPNSKLTSEQITDMRRLYNLGNYSCVKLASMYNISKSVAHRIIKGEDWKEVI